MKKIQVILVAGFLGSGKTTMIGKILPVLAIHHKVALLVNDFGSQSLDGTLLGKYGVPLREISGGSIFCCCKQANLVKQMTEIGRDLQPDILVIESSGLAEPSDTSALLQNSYLREIYMLPQVVTTVDAVNYPRLAQLLPVVNRQVVLGKIVVITKGDLVSSQDLESLQERVRRANPWGEILLAGEPSLTERVLALPQVDCENGASSRLCATATPGFSTINITFKVDCAKLEALMKDYADVLLRAKGVMDGRHLECVNGQFAWSDELPQEKNGLFFALRGDYREEFANKLKEIEK